MNILTNFSRPEINYDHINFSSLRSKKKINPKLNQFTYNLSFVKQSVEMKRCGYATNVYLLKSHRISPMI
jgi:hypothetical protein